MVKVSSAIIMLAFSAVWLSLLRMAGKTDDTWQLREDRKEKETENGIYTQTDDA